MNTRAVTSQYRLHKWTDIIRQCRASGQTVATWCQEHNINPKTYYYWLKRVRIAACQALPALQQEQHSIVPVDLPLTTETTHLGSLANITLRFDHVTVELRNDASQALIENTLKALTHVR